MYNRVLEYLYHPLSRPSWQRRFLVDRVRYRRLHRELSVGARAGHRRSEYRESLDRIVHRSVGADLRIGESCRKALRNILGPLY
jgi:hypothetical protein